MEKFGNSSVIRLRSQHSLLVALLRASTVRHHLLADMLGIPRGTHSHLFTFINDRLQAYPPQSERHALHLPCVDPSHHALAAKTGIEQNRNLSQESVQRGSDVGGLCGPTALVHSGHGRTGRWVAPLANDPSCHSASLSVAKPLLDLFRNARLSRYDAVS